MICCVLLGNMYHSWDRKEDIGVGIAGKSRHVSFPLLRGRQSLCSYCNIETWHQLFVNKV